ncbi:hypothetical protein [Shinella sedimenti]|uniref:Uncharacterized protein n=1 Tax=Shinella sedimenti TaxID=2919913 RepID=A0ABT0CIQ0_9HYPH|nr:hypothetical protein [Shinella sedimenti]MCJ8148119.1 hypothetical protein [Shinella sedimenti]
MCTRIIAQDCNTKSITSPCTDHLAGGGTGCRNTIGFIFQPFDTFPGEETKRRLKAGLEGNDLLAVSGESLLGMAAIGDDIGHFTEMNPVAALVFPPPDMDDTAIENEAAGPQAHIDIAGRERRQAAMPRDPSVIGLVPEDFPPTVKPVAFPMIFRHVFYRSTIHQM